jgi:diguanylate cyclase (GGDEF)-like protein
MSGIDTEHEGQGFALQAGDGNDVPDALLRLCQRLTLALDVWECCIYAYIPERDCLLAQAVWSHKLEDRDREWIGSENHLNRQPDIARVFAEQAIVVTQADDDAATAEMERMEYWGEQTALFAPIVLDGTTLGIIELTEHRRHREFGPSDLRLVEALADVAAVAIDNARSSGRQRIINARLNALLDTSRAISSTVVLDEVLQLVAERVAEALHAPSCYIYEYDEPNDTIAWRSEYQDDPSRLDPDAPGTVYPLDDYPWDRAVLASGTMRQFAFSDPDLEPGLRTSMMEWGEQTLLTVPLRFGDQKVGMMEIAETQAGRRFSEGEATLAHALGERAAAAIRNAQLYRRETWRNERLVKVLDISRTLSASLQAEEVIEGVRAHLGALFPQRTTTVDVARLPGSSDDPGARPGAPDDDQLLASVLADLQPGQELSGDHRRLLAPLVTQGRAEAWLEIIGDEPRAFDEDEVELVQILANQAAAALDSTKLYETLAQQAITDGLTGLFNHRFFYERLRDEVTRARRYNLPLSLLMMDLDDFKLYNDRFGHPAGDGVLRRVAEIMRAQVRKNVDIPARYGGEEFAIILPHTGAGGAERVGVRLSEAVREFDEELATPRGAAMVGERVRHSIEEVVFQEDGGGDAAQVTISIGIASMAPQAADAEDLVATADKALYLAKRLGKNRVEVIG